MSKICFTSQIDINKSKREAKSSLTIQKSTSFPVTDHSQASIVLTTKTVHSMSEVNSYKSDFSRSYKTSPCIHTTDSDTPDLCEFSMPDIERAVPVPVMIKNLNNLKMLDGKPKNSSCIIKCHELEDSKEEEEQQDVICPYKLEEIDMGPDIKNDIMLQLIRKFRHLIFSPEVNEDTLIGHLCMVYHSLVYATKFLTGPSTGFLASRQITLNNGGKELITPRKTLILDLDETLVRICKCGESADHEFIIERNKHDKLIGIKIRPYAQAFIDNMCKIFEIVIFTSGIFEYGLGVASILDPNGSKISAILDRSHCLMTKNGLAIKDLRIIKNRDLKDMVIVDNYAHSFGFQIHNGVPILEWIGDPLDQELKYLEQYLIKLANSKDVREFNKKNLRLHELLEYSLPIMNETDDEY